MNMFTDKGVSGAKNDGDKARIGKDRLGMTLRKSEQNKDRGKMMGRDWTWTQSTP